MRSAGVAVLGVVAVVAVAFASTVSSVVKLLATTVLAMTGTFTSTPYPAYLDMVENQFVAPALGNQIDFQWPPVPATTPEQAWPITGLFDHTFGRSVQIGVGDLETALYPYLDAEDPVLVFGYSQSSVISIIERRKLEQYYALNPELPLPDLRFMCIGCLNLPNGGVMERYRGAYLPFINFYFNGAAAAETPFPTTMITNRWDGFADSPLYPLWLPATINGLLGMIYAHTEYDEWDLADNPDYYVGHHGNTDYYFLPNQKLPLFGPLRSLGVPEEIIDIFEPFFIELVELGYDRSIPPWEPTPARLLPRIDPFTAIPKLLRGINEGFDNALALLGGGPTVRIPAPARADDAPTADPAPVGQRAPQPEPKRAAEESEEPPDKAERPARPARSTASASDSEPQSHRPQTREPVSGPRTRDLLHRGHETAERSTASDRVRATVGSSRSDQDSSDDDGDE